MAAGHFILVEPGSFRWMTFLFLCWAFISIMRKQLFWLINRWKSGHCPPVSSACWLWMELQLSRSAGSHGAPAWSWHRKVLVKVSENFIIAPPSEKCRAACNTQGKGQRSRRIALLRPCLQPFTPKWDTN